MNSLREIKRRLHSIQNIKKITDTMERVAAARLKLAIARVEKIRPYLTKLQQILEIVIANCSNHPLLEKRTVNKRCIIILGADRGLTGAYHTNLFTKTDQFLKNYPKEELELILIGRKAIEYYQHKSWNIALKIMQWPIPLMFEESKTFFNSILEQFLQKNFDEIWVSYTHYLGMMQRKVMIFNLLEVSFSEKKRSAAINYLFEPTAEEILPRLLPKYWLTKLQQALSEAYASELSARVMAMQAASKNSEEMITDLTLVKNKTRQQEITKEMIEIISGVEAFK